MPVHDVLPGSGRHQTCGANHDQGPGMTTSSVIPKHVEEALSTHRRGFLKSAGLLVVSFATGGGALVTDAVAQNRTTPQPAGPYPDPDFRQLDSWIVIHENNTATFYVGKTDAGQGTGTG